MSLTRRDPRPRNAQERRNVVWALSMRLEDAAQRVQAATGQGPRHVVRAISARTRKSVAASSSTGDLVRLDGSTGRVEVLEPAVPLGAWSGA